MGEDRGKGENPLILAFSRRGEKVTHTSMGFA
jgi:hypothetical protein